MGDFTTEGRGRKAVVENTGIESSILQQIKESDFTIINLETPIVDKLCQPIDKFGPNLCTSPDVVNYFKKIGISGVTLANNHFYDYGDRGVNVTIESLVQKGIKYVGGGRSRDEINKILYIK